MADIVDAPTRSRMMSGIRGRNTTPELTVRRFLHGRGFRYRLHVAGLPGRPDIVLPRHRVVIEVRGCFWHRHPGCRFAVMPSSNRDFWAEKLNRNVERDARNRGALVAAGWRVLVIWECETRSDAALARLAGAIIKERDDSK
jgi:DNA mismatch endonuclease, patch repair protein